MERRTLFRVVDHFQCGSAEIHDHIAVIDEDPFIGAGGITDRDFSLGKNDPFCTAGSPLCNGGIDPLDVGKCLLIGSIRIAADRLTVDHFFLFLRDTGLDPEFFQFHIENLAFIFDLRGGRRLFHFPPKTFFSAFDQIIRFFRRICSEDSAEGKEDGKNCDEMERIVHFLVLHNVTPVSALL